jgi:hypothetical protein
MNARNALVTSAWLATLAVALAGIGWQSAVATVGLYCAVFEQLPCLHHLRVERRAGCDGVSCGRRFHRMCPVVRARMGMAPR